MKTTSKKHHADVYDVSSLSISDDPYVGRQRKEGGKYDEIFERLQIGQRLVCHPQAAARLATSLKTWLQKRGHKNPTVKSVATYHDGKGGVWWMGADKAPIKTTLAPGAAWPHTNKKAA